MLSSHPKPTFIRLLHLQLLDILLSDLLCLLLVEDVLFPESDVFSQHANFIESTLLIAK